MRILVMVGWMVIGGMALVVQVRFVEVYGRGVGVIWQSDGVAVGWIPSHFSGPWHVLTAKNTWVAKDYLVPQF